MSLFVAACCLSDFLTFSVHYYVVQKCDNGANIKAAWGELEGHECAAHNIQLSVNKFLQHERIEECITAMNGITAHFRRSVPGRKKLHEIQRNLGLPQTKPPSGCATRWLGSFHQGVWFVQNAAAITAYKLQVCQPCLFVSALFKVLLVT